MRRVKMSAIRFLLIVIFAALRLANGINSAKIGSIFLLMLMIYCLRAFSGVSNLQELLIWVKNKKVLVIQFFMACVGSGFLVYSVLGRDPYFTYTDAISTYILAVVFFATSFVIFDSFISQKK